MREGFRHHPKHPPPPTPNSDPASPSRARLRCTFSRTSGSVSSHFQRAWRPASAVLTKCDEGGWEGGHRQRNYRKTSAGSPSSNSVCRRLARPKTQHATTKQLSKLWQQAGRMGGGHQWGILRYIFSHAVPEKLMGWGPICEVHTVLLMHCH